VSNIKSCSFLIQYQRARDRFCWELLSKDKTLQRTLRLSIRRARRNDRNTANAIFHRSVNLLQSASSSNPRRRPNAPIDFCDCVWWHARTIVIPQSHSVPFILSLFNLVPLLFAIATGPALLVAFERIERLK